jgi:hypothetical protein
MYLCFIYGPHCVSGLERGTRTTSTIFDITLFCCFPRIQFDESIRVFLPKHPSPRVMEIEFPKRAQTHTSNKRITSECVVMCPQSSTRATGFPTLYNWPGIASDYPVARKTKHLARFGLAVLNSWLQRPGDYLSVAIGGKPIRCAKSSNRGSPCKSWYSGALPIRIKPPLRC